MSLRAFSEAIAITMISFRCCRNRYHIAAGSIDKTDGVVSKIDDNGHLSLHEFATTDLAAKFVITSCLL
jgi:hypothetical protein